MSVTPPDPRVAHWVERLFGSRTRERAVQKRTGEPAHDPNVHSRAPEPPSAGESDLSRAHGRDGTKAEAAAISTTAVPRSEDSGMGEGPPELSPVGENVHEETYLEAPLPPSESDSSTTETAKATLGTEGEPDDGREDLAPSRQEDHMKDQIPCLDPLNEWYRVFLKPGTVLVRFAENQAEAPQVIPLDPELWRSRRGSTPGYVRRQ